jgi:ferritin
MGMKLSTKLEKALNEQINLELGSAYAYLAMAGYFESTPFSGFASWMHLQSKEELGHAQRFFSYLGERGSRVSLKAIPEPRNEFKTPLDAFRASLVHEQRVSASICAIYEMAQAEKDYPTLSFLKWFLDEQVEEEKSVSDMIAKLELVGNNNNGLFHLDKLAGKRVQEKAAE